MLSIAKDSFIYLPLHHKTQRSKWSTFGSPNNFRSYSWCGITYSTSRSNNKNRRKFAYASSTFQWHPLWKTWVLAILLQNCFVIAFCFLFLPTNNLTSKPRQAKPITHSPYIYAAENKWKLIWTHKQETVALRVIILHFSHSPSYVHYSPWYTYCLDACEVHRHDARCQEWGIAK